MKKKLEVILVSAILESSKLDIDLVTSSFEAATLILLKNKKIFEKIPEKVLVTSEELAATDCELATTGLTKDLISNFGKDKYDKIEYFKYDGVLIHEGIHASAFGRMSYIYRTKGIRLYFLKNGDYLLVTPYCYIDHKGFQLTQEEIYKINFKDLDTQTKINDLLIHIKEYNNKNFYINQQLIKSLVSVKKKFDKHYFIEYLLTPPDVDEISDFSKKIKSKLWDICLSKSFQKKWGKEIQENAMNYLSKLEISPSSGQILNYIKDNIKDNDLNKIMERIDTLEHNIINQKQDVFEFKPNFNGVGFNVNEIYKRLNRLML